MDMEQVRDQQDNRQVIFGYKMSQSPDQSQKQKKKQKKNKQKALLNFLQAQKVDSTVTAQSDLASTNLSDQQEKVQRLQQKSCTICQLQLGDKKRNCGFCGFVFCSQHMRKKRKNKEVNKFVRICDNCQDRYLYSKYMKLEVKNQESIAVQQSIIEAAKQEIQTKVLEKRKIMQKHQSKNDQITNKRKQCEKKWQQQLNDLNSKNQQLENKNRELENMEQNLKQMETRMPPDLAEDYKTLQIRSQKVIKQIAKYQKLVIEAANAKAKKERQMYEEYNKWESKQRVKLTQKPQDCCIF